MEVQYTLQYAEKYYGLWFHVTPWFQFYSSLTHCCQVSFPCLVLIQIWNIQFSHDVSYKLFKKYRCIYVTPKLHKILKIYGKIALQYKYQIRFKLNVRFFLCLFTHHLEFSWVPSLSYDTFHTYPFLSAPITWYSEDIKMTKRKTTLKKCVKSVKKIIHVIMIAWGQDLRCYSLLKSSWIT